MPIKRMGNRTSNYKGRSRQEQPGTPRIPRTSKLGQQDTSKGEVEWTAEPPKKTRHHSEQQNARVARELLDKKAAARAAATGTSND